MAESQLRRCDSHPVPLLTMSANSSDKSNGLALTGDLKAKEGVPVKETTNESRTANTAVEQPRVAGLEDSGEKNADPRETDEPGGRARDNGLNATTPTTPTGRPLIGGAKILPTEMTRLKIEVIVKESEASSAIFRETLLNPPKIVQEVIKRAYYAYVRPKFPALDFNVTVNKCNFFGKRSETDLSCEDSVQLIGSYELTFTNVELAPNTTLNEYVVRMSPGGADEKTVKADSTNAMSNAEVEKAEVAKSPDKTANLSMEDTETRQNNSEKKTRVQCSSQADVTSEESSDCWDSEEERTERDGFIDVEVESIHQIPNSPPPTESSSLDSQEAEQCADSGIAEACAPAPQPGKRNFFICMTKCDVQGIVGRRIRRRALKMRCPNGGCPEEPRTWTCAMCSGTLYWDYEDALFCKCGILQNHLMRFKCAHVDHGQRYVLNHALLDEAIAGIEPCEDINVVLLGETGVGKSTWINSIFNYLPFASLDAALAADEMQIPIPVSFPVGKIGAAERVFFGIRDENERYEENQSATQRPKTYTFWFRDHLYRFIDVPGVNDTRGMQQDDKNFEMIMNELHHYEKIHAFCILMESGLCRLTISIRHCLGELFSHLHKDAAKNIVFCFTKSKTFNEGATERLLQRELEKLKERRDVQIALNEETMYAFNNEAFRFLCFQKHPSSTGALEHTREELLRNWDVSAESTRRLLLYIASIEPHNTRKFLSLNEAKRVIYQLTPVSAEITKNIQANKRIVRDKMHEINRFLDNLKNSGNLECNMVTTQVTISLRAEPIEHPKTVCAKCIERIPILGTNEAQIFYKQVCHARCSLKRVEPGRYPDPGLLNCAAIKGQPFCKECGCSWEVHMHIIYDQKQEVEEVNNTAIMEQVDAWRFLGEMDARLEQLKKKEKRIKEICVKFVAFLNKNALDIRNDAYGEYLKQAIKIAQEEDDSDEKVAELREYLKNYRAELAIVYKCIKDGGQEVTEEEIGALKAELRSMDEFQSFFENVDLEDDELGEETHLNWLDECES